ncbi:MAG: asparagine synthase (glutamine-hydrolyzing) [Candidatus Rokuibacteriota bacterium]|nr:MAG: asparagine synthase (glutamine-hydrolyzing) [Candidatus Rokubacteria bacterium]
MCGIAGKLYLEPGRPVEREAVEAMGRTLAHRGPDDEGLYVHGNVGLAMRRLAVIDVASGRQPIHNEDRTVWTVYNGEIYNFAELRRDLEARGHRFYTRTDTEVIVHLYEEEGPDFARALNGMFAIALWDATRRRLVLVRDRLGIKPLYVAALGDRLLFGSEIKALLADGLRPSVDVESLSLYLSLLYVPAPHTIYREIRKLEAGHVMVWQDGRLTDRRYWNLAQTRPPARPPRAAAVSEELLALLTDAVRRQLVADVPLGVFLSGGLDSSTVVALTRRAHTGAVKTFSIGFDDPSYDERADARIIARRFETDHTELTVKPDLADLVPRLVHHFDEPFADASAVPTYYLSQLTRRHVTVSLGGDGGDELFAGYVTYQADRLARWYGRLPAVVTRYALPALVRRLPVSEAKVSLDFKARRFVANALLEPGRRHYAWKAFFDDRLKREILADDVLGCLDGHLDAFPAYARHYDEVPYYDDLNRVLYADTKVYLADDILVKVDRMSMAHSLEVRVPLLDHRVVEFMFALPGRLKMPGLGLKRLLKRTMRGLLPAETLHKRKAGFNVPLTAWLKRELRPLVDEYLSPDRIRREGFFRSEVTARLVAEHMAGRADHSRNLWALLLFGVWLEQARTQGLAPSAAGGAWREDAVPEARLAVGGIGR